MMRMMLITVMVLLLLMMMIMTIDATKIILQTLNLCVDIFEPSLSLRSIAV